MRSRGVVVDDAPGHHRAEPLADVALVESRRVGDLLARRRRQLGQRVEQAGAVADARHERDRCGVQCVEHAFRERLRLLPHPAVESPCGPPESTSRLRLVKLSIVRLNSNTWVPEWALGPRPRKDALFEAIAVMGKAFASPRRLELLDLLAQGPRTVDELARASEQSTANTSQHLQALHAAGWSRARAKARACATRWPATRCWRCGSALRDASAARLAEVERAARDYLGDEVEAIGRDELSPACAGATWCSSTCAPPRSSRPDTSRGRARSRSTSSSSGWPSCPRTRGGRLLPRPVLRLRPRSGAAPATRPAERPGAWRTGGRNRSLPRARPAPRPSRGGELA